MYFIKYPSGIGSNESSPFKVLNVDYDLTECKYLYFFITIDKYLPPKQCNGLGLLQVIYVL